MVGNFRHRLARSICYIYMCVCVIQACKGGAVEPRAWIIYIYIYVCECVCLYAFNSARLSICLFVGLSNPIYLPNYLLFFLSIHLSFLPSISLSIYIFHFTLSCVFSFLFCLSVAYISYFCLFFSDLVYLALLSLLTLSYLIWPHLTVPYPTLPYPYFIYIFLFLAATLWASARAITKSWNQTLPAEICRTICCQEQMHLLKAAFHNFDVYVESLGCPHIWFKETSVLHWCFIHAIYIKQIAFKEKLTTEL